VKQTPFWVEDHPRPTGIAGELPTETDYLVIGSGLTGLTAARRLVQAGAAVTVIDAGEIASGASAINGGMVSPDVKAGVSSVHHTHGPEIAREMWDSTVRSVEHVRGLASEPGIDALIHDGGMAALGRGDRQRHKLEKTLSWYRDQFDVDWEILGRDEIGKVVGGGFFDVALFEPEGFGVQPARLSFGLARKVADAGAVLVENCTALSMAQVGGGHLVETSAGHVSARNVIIATNGYTTAQPSPALSKLVVPIGSYIVVTEPVGAELAGRIFPGGAMSYTKRRLLNYMRRTHDDRILLGGRRSLHTGLDLAESAQDLRSALVRYWPELNDVPISHVWGGKLGIPFDLTPHIGRVDGAWYALGYAGHGVGLACQLGHELAGMLLGEDPPSVYSRIAHRGRFYYSGQREWFLTPASYLYRVLDKVGL
jgi:glycine/D-amino acid oxidase-like deaminating enzyme